MEALIACLDEVVRLGVARTAAGEVLQVLSGAVPDFCKYLAKGDEAVSQKLVGKAVARILDVAMEWLKIVGELSAYADKLTPERLHSNSAYAVLSLFPEMGFILQCILGLGPETGLETLDLEVDFKRYKALRYTSSSLINLMRSKFLESSGFDSIVRILATSSVLSLQSRLNYLPLLALKGMISPEGSQSLYEHTCQALGKIKRFDVPAVFRSYTLLVLEDVVLKGYSDYPGKNLWKAVCRYIDVLLRSQETSLISPAIRLYAHTIDSEQYRQTCKADLLATQDSILKQYLSRAHSQKVTEIFETLVAVELIAPETVATIARGSSYLHLLVELLKLSIAARYVDFLSLLAQEDFPLSKLPTGRENECLDSMLAFRFPVPIIRSLIPGSGDPAKISICLKHCAWELIEHHSTNDLRTIRDLFPRRRDLLTYLFISRRRLKVLWLLEKRAFSILPKVLLRETCGYLSHLRDN